MAWGPKHTQPDLVNIGAEQFFTPVQLSSDDMAHCQVTVSFPATGTENAIVSVYATLDDTAEVWDIVPLQQLTLERTNNPSRVSFTVSNVFRFRVGVRRTATTDILPSASFAYRKEW